MRTSDAGRTDPHGGLPPDASDRLSGTSLPGSAISVPLHRVRRPRSRAGRPIAAYTLWSAIAGIPLLALLLWFFVVEDLTGPPTSDPTGLALALLQVLVSTAVTAAILLRGPVSERPARRAAAVQTVPAVVLVGLALTATALPLDPVVRTGMASVAAMTAATVVTAIAGRLGTLVTMGVMALLSVVLEPLSFAWFFLPLLPLLLAAAIRVSLWTLDVTAELEDARDARAQLAVADERLRFSRDLHDVLGRDLSAIAVTAGLTAELSRRSDPRAVDHAETIRDLAQSSLRNVRSVARGYRSVDLDQEVRGAVSLLEASGISVTVTGIAGDVPGEHREHVAWAVREGATNVLRHATATRVRLALSAGGLELANDGAHPPLADSRGTGLLGLSERLADHGAALAHDRSGATFRLTVTLPDDLQEAP